VPKQAFKNSKITAQKTFFCLKEKKRKENWRFIEYNCVLGVKGKK